MEEMAQSLQSLCQDLLDWLIAIGISAAAAASSRSAVKVWYLVLDDHAAACAAVQGFVGLCAGYLGAINGMDTLTLPGTANHHPGL